MPLLIVIVAIVAAALVTTMLLMPPRHRPADLPGLTMADASEGLIVTSIKRGSAADRAGLRVGDTIIGLDGRPVATRAAATSALRLGTSPAIDVQVAHNHAIRHVTLKQGED